PACRTLRHHAYHHPVRTAAVRAGGCRDAFPAQRAYCCCDERPTRRTPRSSRTLSLKILVIEDEARTAEYLLKGLTESGFVVDIAANGMDGAHLASEVRYDLILLDVMLPGADG